MPILLIRLGRAVRARARGWRLSLVIAAFVFATSWIAMAAVEPSSNEITDPANYWWWFLITSATVGYGDFFPVTGAGHVVGGYVVVGGIVALTVLFTELATVIQNARGRRMKGSHDLDLREHIVIIGYTAGRTERIVEEFSLESLEMVLFAAAEVSEHPMPDRESVHFVRGDPTSVQDLSRAAVRQASTVVIDARDDNEALTIAVAVDHLNPGTHLVIALRDLSRSEHLRYVNSAARCVQWHVPRLITEEALDPGISEIYVELMGGTGHGNTYSTRVPDALASLTFGDCQTQLGRTFGATVIAIRDGDGALAVSPNWATTLSADTVLYYLADRRIEAAEFAGTR